MKRIISALLIVVMLVSMVAVSASAGNVFSIDFASTSEDVIATAFKEGMLFFHDDTEGVLCGYYEAKALQSMYKESDDGLFDNSANTWLTYDAKITLKVSDDDAVDYERCVNIAYCNDNRRARGESEGREFITLCYNIEEKKFDLVNAGGPLYDAEAVIASSIAKELPVDGEEYFTLGMSVDKNRIRFFVNDELLYDIDGTQYRVGEAYNSPFFLWNGGNYMQIKDLVVSTPGYIYPYADNSATTTTRETTTSQKVVEVTGEDGKVVTDDKGQAVTSISIVTEAPGAANTNQGGNVNGSSSTGDIAFVVVAAMVATLGCALVIRKVSCR